jgi:hypothetical protein
MEPLHIQFSPSTRMVTVVQSLYAETKSGLTAVAETFDLVGKSLWKTSSQTSVAPDGTVSVFPIPPTATQNHETTFLRLRLEKDGVPLSINTYWVPAVLDNFTMSGCFTGCDVATFADMTDLASKLTRVDLEVSWAVVAQTAPGRLGVAMTIHNPSTIPAFFTRLRVLGRDGTDVLPSLWDDNYIVLLLPNETEIIGVSWATTDQPDTDVTCTATPFNNVVGTPPRPQDMARSHTPRQSTLKL